MINHINYENIIRTIRQEILTQTQLTNDRVLNATSVRGPDLIKILNESESTSFNLSDCFIIFELIEDIASKENVVIPEDEDYMSSVAPFNFTLKIYGNLCHEISQKILARFKSNEISFKLLENNIYITQITFPESKNEIINNTVWQRCDMSIDFKVKFEIEKLSKCGYFQV